MVRQNHKILIFRLKLILLKKVKIHGLIWCVICLFWTNINKVVGEKVSANFLQKYPIFWGLDYLLLLGLEKKQKFLT